MSSSLPKRRNTFHANERVKGKKLAKELFEEGSSFFLYPFVVKYVSRTDLNNTQVLITAPKKKLRRAVDRNLVKRRVREAYRLNKFILLEKLGERDYNPNKQFPLSFCQTILHTSIKNNRRL